MIMRTRIVSLLPPILLFFLTIAPTIQAGQQLVVPLDALQAAFGQRFDRSRQAVFGVLVTARSSDGTPVRLTWGNVRRR